MRRIWIAVCCLVLLLNAAVLAEPHVVIITIDGFAAYNMKYNNASIPTLRKVADGGAVAEGRKWRTPKLREELVEVGELPDGTDKSWGPLSAARKDQIWAAAACHVIKARKPNLLLLHLLLTDGLQHKYGPQTPGAFAAVGMADAHVRDKIGRAHV